MRPLVTVVDCSSHTLMLAYRHNLLPGIIWTQHGLSVALQHLPPLA